MSESSKNIGPNPDGRLDPVFYQKIISEGDDVLEMKKVQIVETGIAFFPYKAVDPHTGQEESLDKTQWMQVYALLNKEPPDDLDKRVRHYYQTKAKEAQEQPTQLTSIKTPA